MDKVLAEFTLEDGKTTFLVKVPQPLDASAVKEPSNLDEQVYKAK